MNLVLFTHPGFTESPSMPRFADSLARAFTARGHRVTRRAPIARVRRVLSRAPLAKWAGYVDQYLIFPREIQAALRTDPEDTLYVFSDQALGPWVPWVAHRPHVVHCHDLLALRSALGQIPENPTGPTGRVYQRYIRRGFRQARHFISISHRTRDDLHLHGGVQPVTSEVVYNGLNHPYAPMAQVEAVEVLRAAGLPAVPKGLILHVSANQWYKNVAGLVRLYAQYAAAQSQPLPLWLVGVHPSLALQAALNTVPPQGRVEVLLGLDNRSLQAAYSVAQVFLFPSLAEGFGWPLVEAQACGCPVITTAEAPMTEVAGPHSRYLPRLLAHEDVQSWACHGAKVLAEVLALPADAREALVREGLAWSRRFDTDTATASYLRVYQQVLDWESSHVYAGIRTQGR
jgi:glycosyltransferase involved in cell wall biosynthesis